MALARPAAAAVLAILAVCVGGDELEPERDYLSGQQRRLQGPVSCPVIQGAVLLAYQRATYSCSSTTTTTWTETVTTTTRTSSTSTVSTTTSSTQTQTATTSTGTTTTISTVTATTWTSTTRTTSTSTATTTTATTSTASTSTVSGTTQTGTTTTTTDTTTSTTTTTVTTTTTTTITSTVTTSTTTSVTTSTTSTTTVSSTTTATSTTTTTTSVTATTTTTTTATTSSTSTTLTSTTTLATTTVTATTSTASTISWTTTTSTSSTSTTSSTTTSVTSTSTTSTSTTSTGTTSTTSTSWTTTGTTVTSTWTTVTATTITATSTTTTMSGIHVCVAPDRLFGHIAGHGGSSCTGLAAGSGCRATATSAHPCIIAGPIKFFCPEDNFVKNAKPFLTSPSIACQVCEISTTVVDDNPAPGEFTGTLYFGPNMVNGVVNEYHIEGYKVFVVDDCGLPLEVPGGPSSTYVRKIEGMIQGCCTSQAYSVFLNLTLPVRYAYFMVVPFNSAWGELDAGPLVAILDDGVTNTVPGSVGGGAPRGARCTTALLALAALAMLGWRSEGS